MKAEHGGGLSPAVVGQLHTPAVEIKENFKEYHIHVSCEVRKLIREIKTYTACSSLFMLSCTL